MGIEALLIDYGDTLLREQSFDPRSGNEWLLEQASYVPPGVSVEDVLSRAREVTGELSLLRDQVHVELPWAAVSRLIHDYLGVRFHKPFQELEFGFWRASVQTEPLPGVKRAIQELHCFGVRLAVLSNSGFRSEVLLWELSRHGLAEHLEFVMTSAEYFVRKPNPMLFQVAAARLGLPATSIWYVGDRLDADVGGARAAGIASVWLQSEGQQHAGAPEPDRVAASWKAVVAHVRTARRR